MSLFNLNSCEAKPMNYLITGGTGLIGSKLISKLKEDQLVQEVNILVLTRNIALAQKKLGATGIKFIDSLKAEHVNHQDVVINLAGEPIANKRWSSTQKNKICQSRWSITEQLATFIKQVENPPSVFISGSAVGIYGRQTKEKITESFTEFNHEFTFHVCNRWEEIALKATSDKTRVTLLRTGIVLDKHGGALNKLKTPFKLGLGGKVSHGKQMMSWIHIDDAVSAIFHIIKNNNLSGPVNLTAPKALDNAKFSHILAKELSRPCALTTPAWLMQVIMGEMSDLLLYGQDVYPEKILNTGFKFSHQKLPEALESLLAS